MSTSLGWIPPPQEVKQTYMGLKYEIAQYFEPDYNGGDWGPHEADKTLIPFLKGIISIVVKGSDAHKDAQSLINGIEKYGKVILSIH